MSLIPDDRMDMQTLIQAFTEYLDARADHDRACDDYEGESWGFHGFRFINRIDDAAREVGACLDRYVDSRVAKAIQAAAATPSKPAQP